MTYRTSRFSNETEVSISYEELTDRKESHTIISLPAIIIMGFTGLFSIASYIWRNDKDYEPDTWKFFILLFIISCVVYFSTREDVWKIKLQNNTYLFINKGTPNKKEVSTFIDNLFNERNRYLRETYFYITINMPYDKQLSNLQWLKKAGALKDGEFEKKREELESMFSPEKKPIGF